jgi:opacity protein-like surface antigen
MSFKAALGSAVLVGLTAASAAAQFRTEPQPEPVRLTAGATWTSIWDDETFLGRGPVIQGGVVVPLGASIAVEAELFGGTHQRDAGYLAADGTPIGVTGRVAYRFGRGRARLRPYVSGGWTGLHSSGTLTIRSILPDDRGFPVQGPATRRDWSVTKAAFELGAGVAFQPRGRVAVRPELRWTMTRSDPSPGTVVELPLMMIRAGITLEWVTRRSQ